jgi:hypothetical protein
MIPTLNSGCGKGRPEQVDRYIFSVCIQEAVFADHSQQLMIEGYGQVGHMVILHGFPGQQNGVVRMERRDTD